MQLISDGNDAVSSAQPVKDKVSTWLAVWEQKATAINLVLSTDSDAAAKLATYVASFASPPTAAPSATGASASTAGGSDRAHIGGAPPCQKYKGLKVISALHATATKLNDIQSQQDIKA
eukprot:4219125-Alexandrium_andersonii.AAC.1